MAGGPLAAVVCCMDCLQDGVITRAVRVHEGTESDQYDCDLGHTFGLEFRRGPATEADWPASDDVIAFAAAKRANR